MAGVLSSSDILREIKDGNIVIRDPINPNVLDQVSNSSFDVTLGRYYYTCDNTVKMVNPWNKDHITSYWKHLNEANTVANEVESDTTGVPIGQGYIALTPGENILAHTNEYIGGKNFITTMMKARSSLGRSGITVCRDAGWGDIDYINRWTMEITNNTQDTTIILPVGVRVAQIVFFYSSPPITGYQGKYQTSKDIDTIIRTWSPECMLPRLYQDS